MGYPTKVQQIRRKKTADQYYINFPTAVAEAMEFEKGDCDVISLLECRTGKIEPQYPKIGKKKLPGQDSNLQPTG